jgi:hypothetical protein
MPEQHPVEAIVGRDDVQQPGDCRRLEFLAAWGMNPRRPPRGEIRCHDRSITPIEQIFYIGSLSCLIVKVYSIVKV